VDAPIRVGDNGYLEVDFITGFRVETIAGLAAVLTIEYVKSGEDINSGKDASSGEHSQFRRLLHYQENYPDNASQLLSELESDTVH
jgi:hypothetical protein